jgi:predicted nucleic-acid-binding protein
MHAIDANVLLRLLTRDNERQVAAAEAFVAKGAWVRQLALAEATWVLFAHYDLDARALATAVETLLNHRGVVLQRDALQVRGAVHVFAPRRLYDTDV